MLELLKDIEFPKFNGGYDLYKKNETYFGFNYKVFPQDKRIVPELSLYNSEGKYINGVPIDMIINENSITIKGVETESIDAYVNILESIQNSNWEWIYGYTISGNNIEYYITE